MGAPHGKLILAASPAVFPWQPDDVIPLFARDSLEWAGRIRIGRVGIRPDGGAAATGYITGHSIHDGTIQ